MFTFQPYLDGMFVAQDIGSMLVSYVLSPEPGENIIDLTAAPGGKVTHIAQLMRDTGLIIACDVHEHRLALVSENLKKLGIVSV